MAVGLVWDGDIDLASGVWSEDGYLFEVVEGYDHGAPDPVEIAISSLMRDGVIVSTDHYENREVTVPIRVRGADSSALALGEQRLALALGKVTTLAYTPPDEIGPTTVFEVLTSSLSQPVDDLAEVRNERTYNLRLVCEPFARSVDPVTDSAAAPPASGGTLLYNFESTSGWASTLAGYTGTYAVDTAVFTEGAGSIRSTSRVGTYYPATDTQDASNNDKVSGLSLSTGTGGYLSVAIRTTYPLAYAPTIFVTTTTGTTTISGKSLLATGTDANGFVRYTWQVAAGLTITALEFNVHQRRPVVGATAYTYYDDLRLATSATTDNQVSKVIAVEGSVRAPGSIHVASPSDSVALGNVLVATVHEDEVPAGFRPDMRRWVTAGTTTTDSTALYGSYYTAPAAYGSTVQFDAPVSQFAPGNHAVVMLVKPTGGAAAVTIGVETQLTFGGTAAGSASATDVPASVATTGWVLIPCGSVAIPTVENPTSTTKIRVRPKGNVPVAEIFLIPEAADFTIANCGTGTVSASGASSHLWVDSAAPANDGLGAWWRGPTGDKANRRRLNLISELTKPGRHLFKPGNVLCWCLATGASGPYVTLEHYPRWFGHAAS